MSKDLKEQAFSLIDKAKEGIVEASGVINDIEEMEDTSKVTLLVKLQMVDVLMEDISTILFEDMEV